MGSCVHKSWQQLTVAASLCAAIIACQRGVPTDAGAVNATPSVPKAAAPAANEPIVIGEFSSLTGSEATFGISTHNGIQLAVEEVNAAGGINGRPIKLVTYDDQGKAQEVGTVVTRLITDDKVVAILGEVASSLSMVAARIAQQYNVPMISPASTNPQVTQIGPMIFRACFIDPFQGYAMAKFAREHLKLNSVALLHDQTQAYSKGLNEHFKNAFVALGGQISSEQTYSGGDQDFSAQLTTIRESNPQGIFLPGYYTDAANIALQARKLGLTIPLMGGDGWDSSKLIEIGGKAIDGSYITNHYSSEDPRPELQAFIKKYQAKFSVPLDTMAVLGYDAAHLLFDAMHRSPSLKGESLAQAIAQTTDFSGISGTFRIDADRNAAKPAVVVQYKNGKQVFVTSVPPDAK